MNCDGWPGLVRGAGLFDAVAGCNLGVTGFVQAARAAGHDPVPLTWCSAEPCAHVTDDAFERITGVRAHELLMRILAGETLAGAFRKLPFLIPLSAQCTLDEPNRALYRRVAELSGDRVASLDFAEGFPPADILECGPAVVAYDADPGAAAAAADAMAEALLTAEGEFVNPLISPAEAVARALWQLPLGSVALQQFLR